MKRIRNIALLPLLAGFLILTACADLPKALEPSLPGYDWELEAVIPMDSRLTTGTLDNGLTYYIRANSRPENRAELRLVINAGSVLEDEDQQGLAHFVEHMAFNGTRNFKKQEIVDFLESIGMRFGPDLNASTGFDQTVYLLQVPTEDRDVLDTALQILEDWAHQISFDPREVEKERGVIIEEWRLGRGAEARLRDRQFPILFQGSRYAARRPIGKPEIIRTADAGLLQRFYRDWYRPDLMAVIAVGDFDEEWMEARLRSKFSRLQARENPRSRPLYPVPDHEETLYAPATDPEATETRVNLYIKHPVLPFETVGDYRQRSIEYLYNAMLNARLDELTRQPDPPYLNGYAANFRAVRSKEFYILGARVPDSKIIPGLETLLVEMERARRHGFTPGELERQKERILTWIGNAYSERENTESQSYVEEYIRHFLQGDPTPGIEYEYRLFRRYLPEIGLEEVNRQARRWLTPENRVVLLSAPRKSEQSLPREQEINALFRETQRRVIEPYEDRVPEQPLIAGPLPGGSVEEELRIPELDLTEWRLSNGVRVLLKPTDFKREEVLLAAISPGGHSLAEDKDFVAAATASAVIIEGGLGEFSRTELEKKLTGLDVEVAPWIGQLFEGMQGSAEPEALETLFQLIYLYFTNPRQDRGAFAAYRERRSAALANRLASPEAVFWDTVQEVITQNHYRARPWTQDTLKQMDLEASHNFYRERFADAGDFTFVVVGGITRERIKPLVERYLGSLPATGRRESWRDLGIDPPRGIIRREVAKGLEPKSRVQIIFSGSIVWSLENRLRLQVLAEVLDIKLRESLREEAGGTYNVGVFANLSEYPDEEYHVYISFGCAPAEADELSALALRQLEELKRQGPSAEELAKVKEILRRQRETELEQNSFWLDTLLYYRAHRLDPRRLLEYESLLEALNAGEVRQTAALHLDFENYVRVTLYPEDWPGPGS